MMRSAKRGKLAQSSTSSLMRQADVAVGTRRGQQVGGEVVNTAKSDDLLMRLFSKRIHDGITRTAKS